MADEKPTKNVETRRNVLKKAGAVGVAATGTAAFAGAASARPSVNIVESASELNSTTEGGQNIVTGGLLALNVSGVSVNALNSNNTTVQINDEVVDISDITVSDVADVELVLNNIDVEVTALNDVNVSVAILGNSGVVDEASFDLTQ